jgi:hypothetical protein
MHCHLLPLSHSHKQKLESLILSYWKQWLNDWMSLALIDNQFDIEVLQCDDNQWSTLDKFAQQDWFCSDATQLNCAFSFGYGFDFVSWMTHSMTGCVESDFNGGVVDINQIVQTALLDLSQKLSPNCQSLSDAGELKRMISLEIDNQRIDFTGTVVKISSDNFTVNIYVSNQLAKQMLLGSKNLESTPKLVPRQKAVGHKKVTVSAQIEGLMINLEDLNSLQVGDILTNRRPIEQQIIASINKHKIDASKIHLGQKNGQRAIKFVK